MNILSLIDRNLPLFEEKDFIVFSAEIKNLISKGRFLILGGASLVHKFDI